MLRALTWLLSFGFHAGVALLFLSAAGGAALEKGTGNDTMVVEQGIAVEGVAKLGQDLTTIEPVEAITTPDSKASPQPQEIKPVEQSDVITSEAGPEQAAVKDPVPEVKETAPPQIAMIQQEATIEQHESSAQAMSGGDTTAQSAYLGALRTKLERSKVNPHSTVVGTAVVRFVVDSSGKVISREIATSSGSPMLDDAAIASIDRASPFPPIPQGLQQQTVEVSVPFKFSVR